MPASVRFSAEERVFLKPFEDEFMAMMEHPHKDSAITDFKMNVCERFIRHFNCTEDLPAVRKRVRRRFSNRKKDDKMKGITPGGSESNTNATIDKQDKKTMAEFFKPIQQRKVTGRDIYLRENPDAVKSDTEQHEETQGVSRDGSMRGQHNKAKSLLYAALPENVRGEYERRARELNELTKRDGEEQLDDKTILRNIENLRGVLTRILTALPGRENSFSVGDAIFTLNVAYLSPIDRKVHTDFVHTQYGKYSFQACNKYDTCKGAWTKFAKHVFKKTRSPNPAEVIVLEAGENDEAGPGPKPSSGVSDDEMSRITTGNCAESNGSDCLPKDITPAREHCLASHPIPSRPEALPTQAPSCDTTRNLAEVDSAGYPPSCDTIQDCGEDGSIAPTSELRASSPAPLDVPPVTETTDPQDSSQYEHPTKEVNNGGLDSAPLHPRLKRRLETSDEEIDAPKKRQRRQPIVVEATRRSTREIVKPARPDAGVPSPVKKSARRRRS